MSLRIVRSFVQAMHTSISVGILLLGGFIVELTLGIPMMLLLPSHGFLHVMIDQIIPMSKSLFDFVNVFLVMTHGFNIVRICRLDELISLDLLSMPWRHWPLILASIGLSQARVRVMEWLSFCLHRKWHLWLLFLGFHYLSQWSELGSWIGVHSFPRAWVRSRVGDWITHGNWHWLSGLARL